MLGGGCANRFAFRQIVPRTWSNPAKSQISAATCGAQLCVGTGGGVSAFPPIRLKQPPALNWFHAQRSQRISDAASHSAHASMRSRYHQMETEMQPGRGRMTSDRA